MTVTSGSSATTSATKPINAIPKNHLPIAIIGCGWVNTVHASGWRQMVPNVVPA